MITTLFGLCLLVVINGMFFLADPNSIMLILGYRTRPRQSRWP
jgi:hypothetical protein